MFFGRDESDFLLGERNGDLAAVFAKLRQLAIIVPTPVSESVVMRIERDEGNHDHRQIIRWNIGKIAQCFIIVMVLAQGMRDEGNPIFLVSFR